MNAIDLSGLKVIAAQDIETAAKNGGDTLLIRPGAILTPSARDVISQRGLKLSEDGGSCGCSGAKSGAAGSGASAAAPSAPAGKNKWEALLNSPEAQKIKEEICRVGRKLWMRQFVDGNGGNISYRLTDEAVLCTPTLVSKGDLKPEDMSLVDLDGHQLAGLAPRTSEILLHLEIYKEVPKARAVVHCHPPHATAYAITGRVPPTRIVPEFDVFVGRVALSPYETPGTKKFAETVIPFVKCHNTVLLANHGIVCWADTVTHAEWFAEVLETYCWTLTIAAQLGSPVETIPVDKADDLLAIKQKLGLPDARFKECSLSDLPEPPGMIALPPHPGSGGPTTVPADEVDSIVKAVTDAVMQSLGKK